MREYSGVARDKGITAREIEAVLSIVMAVSGGRVRAQFRQACAGETRGRTAED